LQITPDTGLVQSLKTDGKRSFTCQHEGSVTTKEQVTFGFDVQEIKALKSKLHKVKGKKKKLVSFLLSVENNEENKVKVRIAGNSFTPGENGQKELCELSLVSSISEKTGENVFDMISRNLKKYYTEEKDGQEPGEVTGDMDKESCKHFHSCVKRCATVANSANKKVYIGSTNGNIHFSVFDHNDGEEMEVGKVNLRAETKGYLKKAPAFNLDFVTQVLPQFKDNTALSVFDSGALRLANCAFTYHLLGIGDNK
jgi:hypothetical protein